MILCDRHRFVFIHIPKCAGSYVRACLSSFDDSAGRFSRHGDHTDLGILDFAHIPLSILEKFFPSEFARVAAYRSFAVVRDPFERFPSSMSEFLKKRKKQLIRNMSLREIRHEVDSIIRHLQQERPHAEPETTYTYIHFTRQSEFVNLGGTRIVQHLYTMDNVSSLLAEIGNLTQTDLFSVLPGRKESNVSLVYRNRGVRSAISVLTLLLGQKKVGRLVSWPALSRIVHIPGNTTASGIFDSKHVRDFVTDYYKEDIDLYESVLSEAAPSPAR